MDIQAVATRLHDFEKDSDGGICEVGLKRKLSMDFVDFFFWSASVSQPVIHISVTPVIPVQLYPLEPIPEAQEAVQQIELPVRDLSELDSVLGLPLLDLIEQKQDSFEENFEVQQYDEFLKVLVDLFFVDLSWRRIC